MASARGTIPALPPYQPGALPIASTINIEIVDSVNATTAASWRMSQTDFVGKAPSAMTAGIPVVTDLVACLASSNIPFASTIGNLGIPFGNLPTGGATGTILAKNSGSNFDTSWTNIVSHLSAGTALTLSGSTTGVYGVTNFGIGSAQIATNAVGNVQFRQGAGVSVVGVGGSSLSNVADIVSSVGTAVLLSNAANNTISFGHLTTSYMPVQLQLANITAEGVIYGNGVSTALAATNFGTTGMFLQGNGSALPPAFGLVNLGMSTNVTGTATILVGGTGTNVLSPFGVMLGGTTTVSVVSPTGATAGYMLLAAGSAAAPTWAGAGAVLLNTLSAFQVASATDTTSLTSRYSRYRITFENVCPVSTATLTCSLNLQIATSGVNWVSANYVSTLMGNAVTTTFIIGTTTAFYLSGITATTCVGTSTLYGVNGWVELTNPAATTFFKSMVGHLDYITPGAVSTLTHANVFPGGFWNGATAAITGIAIAFQTGNIQTGTFRIYGIV